MQEDNQDRSWLQPDNPLVHTKHLFRVAGLLIACLLLLILGRELFVPDTWGQFGAYRGANIAEQRTKPVVHRGDASCEACHPGPAEEHRKGEHASVRCENCHAPLALHAEADKKTADMPVQRSRSLCLRCHRQLAARPPGFPQIQPRRHVEDNAGEWGEEVCLQCHEPHSPL